MSNESDNDSWIISGAKLDIDLNEPIIAPDGSVLTSVDLSKFVKQEVIAVDDKGVTSVFKNVPVVYPQKRQGDRT